MSTLVINREKRVKHAKNTLIYVCIALFLVIFTIIYEKFSFGESSLLMRTMFVSPLIIGLISLVYQPLLYKKWATRFLNASVATFVSGGLVNGIIEVSGRESDYILPYFIVGGVLLIAGLLVVMIPSKKYRH